MISEKFDFVQLKVYLIATLIVFLFFLFLWLPCVKIDLIVSSQPLNYEFKVNINSQTEKIFFNLDILPAQIISLAKGAGSFPFSAATVDDQGNVFLPDLINQEKDKILVFKKDDLEQLVAFKIEPMISEDKRLLNFSFAHWQLKVKEKGNNWANLEVLVKEKIVPDYDFDKIREEIIFKKIESAREKLAALPELKESRIFLWPAFLKRLPAFKERIRISIKADSD